MRTFPLEHLPFLTVIERVLTVQDSVHLESYVNMYEPAEFHLDEALASARHKCFRRSLKIDENGQVFRKRVESRISAPAVVVECMDFSNKKFKT